MSFIFELSPSANGYHVFSTNIESFSTTVLHGLLLHALDKKENNKTRSEARQKQTKQDKVSDLKFITTYNPALPNIHNIIQNNLSILHTDENMKKIFPSKSIKTLYRREKNLKEILSPCFLPNLRTVYSILQEMSHL